MQTLKYSILLIFILSIGSCANSYKTVDVRNQRAGNQTSSKGVTLTYNYDVLKKRYGKKEYTKKIRVVQVEINNQSGYDLIFGKNNKLPRGRAIEVLSGIYILMKNLPFFKLFRFYPEVEPRGIRLIKITESNGEERYLLSNDKIFNSLKQHPAAYLIYFALTPVKLTVNNGVHQSVTPIGYVLGPLLALGNMIMAANANEKFRFQLEQTNLQGQTIKNGETAFGLIGIDAVGSKSLGIKVIIPEE